MSYSFGAKGATKADVIGAIAVKFDQTVKDQPVHALDQGEAQEAVEQFVGLLQEDDTRDISVSVSGSVYTTDAGLQQVSCSINVSLVPRE